MKVGSLFAGIGGFDLAARWMGWETAWFSEIDPYASAVLQKHWPGVPNHGDITQIDFAKVESVDLLCGGFPCQPTSRAGRQLRQADDRWLWPEYARAVRDLRPRYVVIENPPGLFDGGIADVLRDLAALRYDAEWEVVSAASVGSPQLRERIWFVAYPSSEGCCVIGSADDANRKVADPLTQSGDSDRCGSASSMADAQGESKWGGLRKDGPRGVGRARHGDRSSAVEHAASDRRGEGWTESVLRSGWHPVASPGGGAWNDGEWQRGQDGTTRLIKPGVRVLAHGIPSRVDQCRGLGNAIVPQCAYVIFQAIQEAEERLAA